jgi:serine/threonine-protein kinase
MRYEFMTLNIGTQLGSHEITALLGKGGMGEVYRARDLKLKREVAIKVLPEDFSHDVDRVTRFQREAEVLASLNHPNIAGLYDLEEANGSKYLVLELVEGETLADRIARGPIAVEEALNVAKQICEGLEAAHERGIIHRDLKPANIKSTDDGTVKVLDFGLAKIMENAPSSPTLSNSPTMLSGTIGGMIVGTAAYMSPEQAKGRAADQRTDVFALGCVLYEMLTGQQAFHGEDVSEILASVLKSEPDMNLMPGKLNPRLVELLVRCLAKNRKDRWHAAGDLRIEIETIIRDPHGLKHAGRGIEHRSLWKRAIPIVASALLMALTAVVVWNVRSAQQPQDLIRFPFVLPDGEVLTVRGSHIITISPDGTKIVYAADQQLYLRTIAEMEARPIPGTAEGTHTPFFSPDGRWLGYFTAERKLKKIAITGGASVTICDAGCDTGGVYGASWDSGGHIFIGEGRAGILRVSSGGGKPENVVTLKTGEIAHGPQVLPGGHTLLFTLLTGSLTTSGWDKAQIVVQSLDSGERKVLFEGGSDARYVPTGHIVYALGSTLLAVPFDVKNLRVNGDPVAIVEGVRRASPVTSGAAQFSFSNNGSLVYIPGESLGNTQRILALVDLTGARTLLNIPPGLHEHARISPNAKQLALQTSDGKESFISIYDLNGAAPMRRLTFGSSYKKPIWTIDSQRVVFTSALSSDPSTDREGDRGLFWQPADGNGPLERLTEAEPGTGHQADVWTPDGKTLIFTVSHGGTWHLSTLAMGADQKPKPLMEEWAANPSISRDGRWLAYISNESGRQNIYVQPFPPTGAKYQVSTAGGRNPLWSSDGTRLFYLQDDTAGTMQIVSVDVQTQPSFAIQKTTPLPIKGVIGSLGPRHYDISPDGKYFVVMLPKSQADAAKTPPEQINITLNWFEELKKRVPVH